MLVLLLFAHLSDDTNVLIDNGSTAMLLSVNLVDHCLPCSRPCLTLPKYVTLSSVEIEQQ